MSSVERLLADYLEALAGGGPIDPHDYLDQVEGPDRERLLALMDAFLARAPLRPFDAEVFRGSSSEQLVERIERSLGGVSGRWPLLLPALRNTAKLKRDEVVSRLATALGLASREADVAVAYHEMEHGTLPSDGVTDRVLEALGSILGETAQALREAGHALTPSGSAGSMDDRLVFTRLAFDSDQAIDANVAEAPGVASSGESDAVDDLFRNPPGGSL